MSCGDPLAGQTAENKKVGTEKAPTEKFQKPANITFSFISIINDCVVAFVGIKMACHVVIYSVDMRECSPNYIIWSCGDFSTG